VFADGSNDTLAFDLTTAVTLGHLIGDGKWQTYKFSAGRTLKYAAVTLGEVPPEYLEYLDEVIRL
jgi:hypothetical protein